MSPWVWHLLSKMRQDRARNTVRATGVRLSQLRQTLPAGDMRALERYDPPASLRYLWIVAPVAFDHLWLGAEYLADPSPGSPISTEVVGGQEP